MILSEYCVAQPLPTGALKVTAFKTTRAQVNWLGALQLAMEAKDRTKVLKRLIEVFFAHFDSDSSFSEIEVDVEIEQSILLNLFKDSQYSLKDLRIILRNLNYQLGCPHESIAITVKFSHEQLHALKTLYRSGLVLSLSEAIRFVCGFYIILLSRLMQEEEQ